MKWSSNATDTDSSRHASSEQPTDYRAHIGDHHNWGRQGCYRAADTIFDGAGSSSSTTQIVQGEPGIICQRSAC